MIDLNKSIFENSREKTLICAHRGFSGADIPCNSMAAFRAAVMSGADMIELDVTKSIDGKYFVFHPGMEHAHLRKKKLISTMRSDKVRKLHFVNQDDCPTDFGINTLEEVFDYLRGKCYINVDKYWTDIPGITECIRKCGVEKQVVVKTAIKDRYIKELLKYAPDLMFMPIVRHKDDITDDLIAKGINCIGAEVLFERDDEPVASSEYIQSMHDKGLVVFGNAIVYNKNDVIAAGHSDDNSFVISPDYGWGWLIDKGF
ncbi:MAG: glycerophosphodiester phosphodiesterase family protein, partial [Clostridia bacterium]|nr:glycerophosphodiester phosphodiesterase family protein [Clostridia bacterium]